jgi:LmbE family N-acetylglucosaminyl deacetylase
MRGVSLSDGSAPNHVLAVGAHPDDIEIGCGGTLLALAAANPALSADLVILTGEPLRQDEARHAAELFLPDHDVRVHTLDLPDSRLPSVWNAVKDALESVARESSSSPDLVLTPRHDDAHQDHRLVAELVPTVWRDHFILEYEIPKWDGDMSRPSVYLPLTAEQMQEKVLRLRKAYPSQVSRDWWDDEVFYGLARLRGMECRARYAEAFHARKIVLTC